MTDTGFERREAPQGYNVVFRSKETGVITWTNFTDKEKFGKEKALFAVHEDVLAEGISEEECIRLVHTTPDAAYVKAALLNATDKNGNIIPELLPHNVDKAAFAIVSSRRARTKGI